MRVFALAVAGSLAVWTPLQAETHRLIPERFYNTYSFAHPPALRIKSGDRVVTKTIDAGGVDWNGKSVAAGPNPQTGPFYIDGAEPGDVLVVKIEKLETNRTMAYSGSLLSPYTVDPAAIAPGSTAYGASRLLEYAMARLVSSFTIVTTSTSPGSAPSM